MGISREQALDCLRSDDLVGMGMEADAVRRRLHPEGVVSYAVAREVVCAGPAEAVVDAVVASVERGASGVRLRKAAEYAEVEALLREMRKRLPEVWIEGPCAARIAALAAAWGIGVREAGLRETGLRETLTRLQDAGLDTIGGDGVDLRDEAALREWLAVHRAAHGLGMRTAAWMTFGAGETLEQRVEVMEAVRGLQAETGGFTAVAPMAAAALGGRELDGVTAVERLKMLAVARMFVDTVESVQAATVQADDAAQGLKVLQTALRFGANDVGLVAPDGASEEDVRRVIRDAGFRPAERDMAYRAMMVS